MLVKVIIMLWHILNIGDIDIRHWYIVYDFTMRFIIMMIHLHD